MLKIKLLRVGRKHDPSFRVVIVDAKRAPQSGFYLENVGFYNSREKKCELKNDRINYWISKGAQPTDVVHNLLITKKVIEGKKIKVSSHKGKKRKDNEAEPSVSPDEVVDTKSAKVSTETSAEEVKKEEKKPELVEETKPAEEESKPTKGEAKEG